MSRLSAAPTAENGVQPKERLHTMPSFALATPHTVSMTVTPELAQQWLGANDKNRPVRKTRVAVYAREMREGRWKLNGEAIKWSKDGRLLDGQHRLFACIEAGVPFETDVRFGLDDEVFTTLDRAAKRTAGDNLALLGEANADVLAAAIKKLVQMQRGMLFQYGPGAHVSNDEIVKALEQHQAIRMSVPYARKVGRLAPPSLITFMHYLFTQTDRTLANWFMDSLGSGIGLQSTHGVYHLRQRLERNLIMKAKLPEREVAALMIKAWNSHVEGRKVRSLRWRNTGDKPEPFPEIR